MAMAENSSMSSWHQWHKVFHQCVLKSSICWPHLTNVRIYLIFWLKRIFPVFSPLCLLLLVSVSRSVVPDSLRPHGLQHTRFLCPWDFPGRDIGVGCHFLLQGIFPTQGSSPGQAGSLPTELQGKPLLLLHLDFVACFSGFIVFLHLF